MSDMASGLPNKREAAPFVDPWSKEPNHQGVVPVDALFVGSWDNYVGIDDISNRYEVCGIPRRGVNAGVVVSAAAGTGGSRSTEGGQVERTMG
jgi:hypothetical protein